jgi:signal transduction histidine kinase
MDGFEKPVDSESVATVGPQLDRHAKREVRAAFWAALMIGFGSLIALTALSGLETLNRVRSISARISRAYQNNLAVDKDLADIRSELQTSAILVRDYLVDHSPERRATVMQRMAEIRRGIADQLGRLRQLVPAETSPNLDRMSREMNLYWASLEPVFTWTPEQIEVKGSEFVKTRVPRRAAILEIVSRIETINQQTLAEQRREVDLREQELPVFVHRALGLTVIVGMLIAGMSLYWITRVERTSQARKLQIEKAGYELRRLTQQLVHAQEEERKRLSHELHDEVGQLLTALRIELGNLGQPGRYLDDSSRERLAETKALAEQALRFIRDMAMGLRPAMLDELGLIPALEWQSREHSRRTGIPVSLEVQGGVGELPEEYRTCIYRVVQEALTNIAKHASATNIVIGIRTQYDALLISIEDDGVGFDPAARGTGGLGLLGMAERVKKLDGELEVHSEKGHGTQILARIPLRAATLKHEEDTSLVGG